MASTIERQDEEKVELAVNSVHAHMCEITFGMHHQIDSLYGEIPKESKAKEQRPSVRQLQAAATGAGNKLRRQAPKPRKSMSSIADSPDDSDGGRTEQNEKENSPEQDVENAAADDSDTQGSNEDFDVEDYDIEKSSVAIHQMLKNLEQSSQIQMMENLFTETSARAAEATKSREDIENADVDWTLEKERYQHSLTAMEKAIEERELDAFQELHTFNKNLQTQRVAFNADMAEAYNKRRAKLSKRGVVAASLNNKSRPKKAKFLTNDDKIDLDQLRHRLTRQAEEAQQQLGDIDEVDEMDPNGAPMEPNDLLSLLSGQQNDMSGIRTMADQQAKRLKLLRSSLAYVKGEAEGEPDEGVQDLIAEVKHKVYIGESKQPEASGAGKAKGFVEDEKKKDRELLAKLEIEVADLREKADTLKAQVTTLMNVGIPMPTKGKSKSEPEKTALMQEAENLEPDEDSPNPYLRLEALNTLIPQAEVVLRQVEDERTAFLDSLARSRRPLLTLPKEEVDDHLADPDSAGAGILASSNSEVESHEKAEHDLQALRDDMETQKMATVKNSEEIEVKKKAVSEAKEQAQKMEHELQKSKHDIHKKLKDAECPEFSTKPEGEAVLQDVNGQIADLLERTKQTEIQIQIQRQLAQDKAKDSDEQIAMSTNRTPIETGSQSTSLSATSSMSRSRIESGLSSAVKKQEASVNSSAGKGAGESIGKKSSKEVAEPQKVEEPLSPLSPKRKIPPKPKNQTEADMQKLLQIQKENAELAKQIEMLEEQTEKMNKKPGKKSKKSSAVDLNFLKKSDPEGEESKPEEVDPEHLALQKKIRKLQKDLHAKRTNWAKEKKAEAKQRQPMGTQPVDEAEDPDAITGGKINTPHSIFERIRGSLQATAALSDVIQRTRSHGRGSNSEHGESSDRFSLDRMVGR